MFPQLRPRYLIVVLTFAATFIAYLERVGFSVAYTAVAIEQHVDQATKGWVLSSFYYGYAVSQIPGGWAAAKYSGRRVLLFSFLLWSVCSLLTPARAQPLLPVVVARFLIGIAQGVLFPSIHTVLAQWIPPHEKSRAVSLVTSGMYLGAAAAMLVVPTIVEAGGPRTVFVLMGALGVTWAGTWALLASEPPGSEASLQQGRTEQLLQLQMEALEAGEGARAGLADDAASKNKGPSQGAIPWGPLLRSPAVWAIVANNFTFHYAFYVLMNWLPTYFEQGLHANLARMGAAKMLPYLVMFLALNGGGVLADRLVARQHYSVVSTRKLLNTLGFGVAAAAFLLMPRFRSVGGAVGCSSVALGACAFARAGFAVNHMDIAPRYAGVVMGLSNTAGTLAGVVGVAASGMMLVTAADGGGEVTGWGWVFGLSAMLVVVGALFFLRFARGEKLFF
jgi:ACS family sodium-dependent inorganic phosphate cotransporter